MCLNLRGACISKFNHSEFTKICTLYEPEEDANREQTVNGRVREGHVDVHRRPLLLHLLRQRVSQISAQRTNIDITLLIEVHF